MVFLRKWYYTLFKKEMELHRVFLYAPVSIRGASNYIEWEGDNILQCIVETASETKKVKGSRYHFQNDTAHKNLTLVFLGWNAEKRIHYKLTYMPVRKKELTAPVFAAITRSVKRKTWHMGKPKTIVMPTLEVQTSRMDLAKVKLMHCIDAKIAALKHKLDVETSKT